MFDKADTHGVGDAVGCRLVGIQHPVELLEVVLIFLEQRAGQHVAELQHDTEHFARFDPARDDALRQVAGVSLQDLDAAGFQRFHVLVVH